MSFEAKEDKIDKLLSMNILEIPRNQRKYVWGQTNWSDLLSDIKFIVDNCEDAEHFLGSIVLRSEQPINGIEKFSIIDGQQRTITIVLFLLAIIFLLQQAGAEEDVKGTMQYLSIKDRKNIQHIVVNSENHLILKDLSEAICNSSQGDSLDNVLTRITITNTNKIYINCFEYFYNTLLEYYKTSGIEYILKIKDSLLDARYIRINADSDADAYTVFEILNARGQSLEDHELLKNYIMRYILPKEKVDEVKTKWNEIEDILGSNIVNFFRHYVTHKIGNGSSEIYRTIQKKFPKEAVDDLLNDLYKKSSLYGIIINPDPLRNKDEFRILSFLKSSRSQQLRPLILSLLSSFERGSINHNEYIETLRFIQNFFICFTLISSEKSNKLTEIIEKYAPLIEHNKEEGILDQLKESMRNKLPSLDTFKQTFKELGYSNHYDYYKDSCKKRQVYTALKLLEWYLSPSFSFDECTIEHILPDSQTKENATIGNLTLIEEDLNKKCRDKCIEDKFQIYADSNFKMTRRLTSQYNDPNSFKIDSRANLMADMIYKDILGFGTH